MQRKSRNHEGVSAIYSDANFFPDFPGRSDEMCEERRIIALLQQADELKMRKSGLFTRISQKFPFA
jgi:hypothetical protein